MRIVVGISGASGSIYGIRLMEKLRQRPEVEIHLILTRAGEKTLFLETGKLAHDVKGLADCSYSIDDIGCRLASGSFPTDGMVIAACSVHTMSAIAAGISSNLLIRAADVALKERRKLILMVRESPFHLGHLRTMTALAEMGAIIAPPSPPSTTSRRASWTWWITAWIVSSICWDYPIRKRNVGTARIHLTRVPRRSVS